MSVETEALSLIPQYGEKAIPSAKLTEWKATYTAEIAVMDSRITGNNLDRILINALVYEAYIFLGIPGADLKKQQLDEITANIQKNLAYTTIPRVITRPRLHKCGKLPKSITGDI